MSDVMTVNQELSQFTLNQPAVMDQITSLLTNLLDQSSDAILVIDQNQETVFINQALINYLDLPTREQIYGLQPAAIFTCLNDQHPCNPAEPCKMCGILQAINHCAADEASVQEVRIIQQEALPMDMRVSKQPLLLENQHFTLFTLQDISAERHRLQLDRMFFHDVLNTAGLVKGYADILQDANGDELELIRAQLHRTSARLISEIESQRILNAAENNDLQIDWSIINAGSLLQDLQAEFCCHEVARGRHLQIIQADDVMLTTDTTLLSRVLGNLIKNGLEASAEGDVISLECRRQGSTVIFTVHNPAVIPNPIQQKIFKRVVSTKGRGRGIGTYSARLLTERYLNGEISFTSHEDEGTTFRVAYLTA